METMFVDMNIKLPQIYNSSGINVTQVLVGQIKNLTRQIVKLMLLELDFKCSFLWFKVYLKVSLYMIAGYIQAEKKQVLSKIADTFTSEV